MLASVYELLFVVSEIIALAGIGILIYGSIKVFFIYLSAEKVSTGKESILMKSMHKIRYEMGMYILFALDFLIVADIILTISKPSMEELIQLSVMIVIRTMIGFFLSRELEHGEKVHK